MSAASLGRQRRGISFKVRISMSARGVADVDGMFFRMPALSLLR
jgi:hypothetical protein